MPDEPRPPLVLVVDDDDMLREVICSVLAFAGYRTAAAAGADEAGRVIAAGEADCVVCDLRLRAGGSGLDVLRAATGAARPPPVVLVSAYIDTATVVEAMRGGAADVIEKPFDPSVLLKALARLAPPAAAVRRTETARPGSRFVTRDPATEKVRLQAEKVGRVDTSVLVTGESGTGKELLARLVHDSSPRRSGPFLALNCGAIPDNLLESELFGHEEGAFTGAFQARAGLFESAAGGTVFLDEIGDMPANLQVKLLRVLQEREVKRVGAVRPEKVDVRIVSATNQDLARMMREGRFREDLYYRLAVVTLDIPPLRERIGDVELLARTFAERYCDAAGLPPPLFAADASAALLSHSWPGNVRELANAVERAVLTTGGTVDARSLGLTSPALLDFSLLEDAKTNLLEIAGRASREAEASAIRSTLARTSGNKSKAAKLLGVSYKTLLNKVKEYEIAVSSPRE